LHLDCKIWDPGSEETELENNEGEFRRPKKTVRSTLKLKIGNETAPSGQKRRPEENRKYKKAETDDRNKKCKINGAYYLNLTLLLR
jgi:hypothetical protein